MSRVVGFVIRLAIGIASIGALYYFNLISTDVLLQVAASPGYLVAAYLCLLATPLLNAVRWFYLLRAVGLNPTLGWTTNVVFIGLFFSTFLPGSHGGDLVRISMAYRAAGRYLNRITMSVIVDRLSGLLSLLVLGIALLVWLPVQYQRLLTITAIVMTLGLVCGCAAALVWGRQIAALISKLPKPVGPILSHMCSEVVTALEQYVSNIGILVFSLVVSLVQYLFIIASLVIIGWAMGFTALPVSGYGIASAWALVANALPVSPGGLGVGEGAFAQAATALEAVKSGASYATVFLVMRVLAILVGFGGIFPLLIYRTDVRGSMAIAASGEIAKSDRLDEQQSCMEQA